jgi:hypothetical protein
MSIRVTCPSCHTRFNVSEKFAGKEGPCPKCKGMIRIPAISEEVVIHAPAEAGPKDSTGKSILKPIRRSETKLSGVQIALIASSVIGFLLVAVILRFVLSDDITKFPLWLMIAAPIIIAPPLGYMGYHLLRDQEMGTIRSAELWIRVGISSAIYAILWLAFPLAYYAFNNEYGLGAYLTAIIAMLGVGGVAGMYCFDLEYLMGLVHYGMYFVVCLVGRWIAGLGFLPSNESVGSLRIRTTSMIESVLETDFANWSSQVAQYCWSCFWII